MRPACPFGRGEGGGWRGGEGALPLRLYAAGVGKPLPQAAGRSGTAVLALSNGELGVGGWGGGGAFARREKGGACTPLHR